ncbi:MULTISPECIES: hypothetical protein [unclassified Pseudonocardia]|uniref:hypothetical protein n=1 Tax=unclassified Pseudonocardia TaxID=2619320 RepID=UPI0009653899|nr:MULTISPECIES: hypothetical protein [unclassified Pseudonocardia]MBN9097041.1 hypothetical protein [Pseudonocardia sp.]OJY45432.1 MAG: hypothetical protein BGP03_05545 [Pseudonocardia sp. 73-21]
MIRYIATGPALLLAPTTIGAAAPPPAVVGAYAVGLPVTTPREEPLTDIAALKEFLAGYHEQAPSTWREIAPGRAHLRPGGLPVRRAGPATEVSPDGTRFDEAQLLATAAALTPCRAADQASGSGELACAQ